MRLLTLTLNGHLTADSLRRELEQAEQRLGIAKSVLVVDARPMTGYDEAARELFVAWNAKYRDEIQRVSIITDKLLWRMVIRTMSMVSKQEMMPFTSLEEGLLWATRGLGAEAKNTIAITVGRLMEVRLRDLSAAELSRFIPVVTAVRAKAVGPGVMAIVDMRSVATITPEFLQRCTQLMQRWNLGVVRVAILLPSNVATAATQLGEMLRAAGNPNRRLFAGPTDAEQWLGEVLTEPERVRLKAFLAEG